MTRYSAAAPSFPAGAFPPTNVRRTATEARVPAIAFWSFLAFYLFSLLNFSGIFTMYYKWESLPIQPVAFAAAFAMVIPLTRGKPYLPYFTAAWFFWLAFTVGGYLGGDREAGVLDYELLQLVFKLWISLVGLPLMTIRAVNRDKLPMVGRITTVAGAVGAVFAVIQMLVPGPFRTIVVEAGRGAGFWTNPNGCAEICTMCLFISFIYPFQSKLTNSALRSILIAGTLATLSRSGIVLLVAGFLVYGIAAKRLRTVLKIGFSTATLLVIAGVLVGQLRASGESTKQRTHRLDRLTTLLSGDLSESKQDRQFLWAAAIEAVRRGDPIFGLGHRFDGSDRSDRRGYRAPQLLRLCMGELGRDRPPWLFGLLSHLVASYQALF